MRRTWIGAAAAAGITTIAVTGLALAQEKQDQQTPETQHMEKARPPAQIEKAQPGAGQAERQTGKEAQEQKTPQAGPNAEKEKAQTGQAMQPESRQGEKAQTGQAASPEKAQTGQAAAPETRQGGQTPSGQANATAPRPGGNAAAVGKVQISSTTATRISEALISTAPATSQNINIAVNIGAPLPGEVELLPLPPAVVSLVPEYQGFEYVVVNDQVAIVQPSTRVVVEIIAPTGVAAAPAAPPPAVVNLTDAQQQLLVESVQDESPQAQMPELADGQTVPQNIELMPVPSAVVAQVPMIERYRVAAGNHRVVLVDPGTRVVVHVVR
jgi:DNA mismatch repair ATPase MutL